MPIPLLANELTLTQRVSLAALKTQPGYAVLELLFKAAIKRADEELVKLNPSDEGYERKLKAHHQKLRERTEFAYLVLSSIDWQAESAALPEAPQPDKPDVNPIIKGMEQ